MYPAAPIVVTSKAINAYQRPWYRVTMASQSALSV